MVQDPWEADQDPPPHSAAFYVIRRYITVFAGATIRTYEGKVIPQHIYGDVGGRRCIAPTH
jgi:hypothetical protein